VRVALDQRVSKGLRGLKDLQAPLDSQVSTDSKVPTGLTARLVLPERREPLVRTVLTARSFTTRELVSR
jgi:hypothetical protein